jgi:glycosyltransferase involved in cell wall biosynthesis
MRIAFNAGFWGDRCNGTASVAEGFARCLASLGHELVLYSPRNHYSDLPQIKWRPTPASLSFGDSGHANVGRFAWTQTALPYRLRGEGADFLLSPSIEGPIRAPIPQVVTVLDLIPLFYKKECPRLYLYYRTVLPLLLKRAVRVLAISEDAKKTIVEYYRIPHQKIFVVYPALRREYFERPARSTEYGASWSPFFLFVGSFAKRKNLDTVIRAFAKVHESINERLLVVAHPEPRMKDMIQLASELGVAEKVEFVSGLGVEQLASLYRRATALVLLSQYEGFGYPPLEAMACGTPAIVSDCSSLPEVVGESALRLKPNDVDGAGVAMVSLSKDPGLRAALAAEAKKRAEFFCWERTKQQLSAALSY